MRDQLRSGFIAVLLSSLLVAIPRGDIQAQSSFSYAKDDDAVVLRYARIPAELEAVGKSTTVTVYGSGRVLVDFPQHSVRKGTFQTVLKPTELDALMTQLVESKVMEFENDDVARLKSNNQRADGIVTYVADADLSTMTINLSQYGAAGAMEKKVSIYSLQSLSDQFPSEAVLTSLATTERRMIDMIDSEQLSPLP